MPTIGSLSGWSPADPANGASPYANTPPSAAASQYPCPDGVDAMPTTGGGLDGSGWPLAVASPNGATEPGPAAAPAGAGVGMMAKPATRPVVSVMRRRNDIRESG